MQQNIRDEKTLWLTPLSGHTKQSNERGVSALLYNNKQKVVGLFLNNLL